MEWAVGSGRESIVRYVRLALSREHVSMRGTMRGTGQRNGRGFSDVNNNHSRHTSAWSHRSIHTRPAHGTLTTRLVVRCVCFCSVRSEHEGPRLYLRSVRTRETQCRRGHRERRHQHSVRRDVVRCESTRVQPCLRGVPAWRDQHRRRRRLQCGQ